MFTFKIQIILWLFALICVPTVHHLILERASVAFLKENIFETSHFREQCLSADIYSDIRKKETEGFHFGEILAATMLDGSFSPKEMSLEKEKYIRFKNELFYKMCDAYEAVWADLEFFPVASDEISFENTWWSRRTYGGERFHEGTDLFGQNDLPGYYPVISMTNGVVEQVGWLPLGGYRIGIRSPHGGYFYYAHLSEYAHAFNIGDIINAGEILGYMGNTGYGEEGTHGLFPVHLHLGIYIRTEQQKELSVNPYWVLKALKKKMRNYTY